MLKRVAVVVLLTIVGAGCHWLRPQPGFGPNLQVRVSPPGAQGARVVDVIAADLPDGTPAKTTVRLDNKHGALVATGSTLPVHFTFDVGAAGSGLHSFWVQSRVGDLKRRGIGFFTGGIRLNQLQALGTHNSYHTYPAPPLDGVASLDYYEDPLDVQLQDQGVRQFELDVNVTNDGTGLFDVLHVQGLDEGTTCRAFLDCLTTIRNWSVAHPQHAPIAILLELKNNDFNLPVPFSNWVAGDLDRLDTSIRSVFRAKEMFTPDDLRGRARVAPGCDRAGRLARDQHRSRSGDVPDGQRGDVPRLVPGRSSRAFRARVVHQRVAGRGRRGVHRTQRLEGFACRYPVVDRGGVRGAYPRRCRHRRGARQRHDDTRRRARIGFHVGELGLRGAG